METKRKRRTKAEIEKSKGLGDTIEKITTATGIKAIVKFIAGEDCGCEERKQKLNELFPYKNAECLTEDEYDILKSLFNENIHHIKPSDQIKLLKIYNRVFNKKQMPTSCSDCWRQYVSELKKIYSEYENN
jgi:hypothetical protein